jgi:hypothetical protein
VRKYEKPGGTIPTHEECHDALEFFMEHALLTGLLAGESDLVSMTIVTRSTRSISVRRRLPKTELRATVNAAAEHATNVGGPDFKTGDRHIEVDAPSGHLARRSGSCPSDLLASRRPGDQAQRPSCKTTERGVDVFDDQARSLWPASH